MLGQYADAGQVSFTPHVITRKQLQLIGSWGFEARHVDRAISLLDRTDLKDLFTREITHRFALADANAALEIVREWKGGKTVLHHLRERGGPAGGPAPTALQPRLFGFSTRRLFCTGPKLRPAPPARMPATFFSISLLTTPSSVTLPLFTMMWIGGTAWIA